MLPTLFQMYKRNNALITEWKDKNVTNSPYPYLTECFRNTILQWVPMGIFWLILPLWLYMLNKRRIKLQALVISMLFIIKMVNTSNYLDYRSKKITFKLLNF
ncbi:unnamed protein product [Rotaria sp. Silwood2]|nr:unnamed protein product [Rotaria sp. Silwood2]